MKCDDVWDTEVFDKVRILEDGYVEIWWDNIEDGTLSRCYCGGSRGSGTVVCRFLSPLG